MCRPERVVQVGGDGGDEDEGRGEVRSGCCGESDGVESRCAGLRRSREIVVGFPL